MYQTNIDTVKFSVSLLNQLKKKGLVETQNKLINSGLSSLNDSNLRLLIELQSSSEDCNKAYRFQDIRDKSFSDSRVKDLNNQEKIIKKMLFIKLNASMLIKAIGQKNLDQCSSLTQQIINRVSNLQDIAYLFQILFHVKSLYLLEVLNIIKTDISNLQQANKQIFLYMVALVKISNRKDQSKEILSNSLKGKYKIDQIQRGKRSLLLVLKLLLDKEKQLIKQFRPTMYEEQNSRLLYYESTRKIIKNKFFLQFRIDLDFPFQDCEKQIALLDQKSYLLALPLFHFYFENNQKVTEKLALTQINRKISVAKSVLIETLPLSTNGKNRSKSKLKFRYPRNPKIYPKYIEYTAHKNQNYIQICEAGEHFLKYNYNNLYSARKFVVMSREILAWAKSKSDIEKNSTKIKMKNIVGILYGNISIRLQQSQEQGPCFSFLLNNRTVDLSIQKEDKQTLHRFILGANSFISKFHKDQREKISKEIETKSNYSVVKQNNNMMAFHETKCYQLTHGKLLWRDLFISLNRKAKKFESELFAKSKCINYLANKQSINNSKVSNKKLQL